MKRNSLVYLKFLLVGFFTLTTVGCYKESSTTYRPIFEGKFKYKKCYTYTFSDSTGYQITNINTHNYNLLGDLLESIDSVFSGPNSFRYYNGYTYTYFGKDSIHETYQTNGFPSYTYVHYLKGYQDIAIFIQGTWMYFNYYGNRMTSMHIPADPSNPAEYYDYCWDDNDNLTKVVVNGQIWQEITFTEIDNNNNEGDYWDSGRRSRKHPSKHIYYATKSGLVVKTIDFNYHITSDGFADTVYKTTTYNNPPSVLKQKLVYVK